MPFFNLSAFYFFYFSATGAYIIFLPKILYDIGYSSYEIGLLFAIAPLMKFVTPFFFLKRIQLTKQLFVYSLYLTIIGAFFFYATLNNFVLFAINNIILGICVSFILPYMETKTIKQLGKSRYGKSRLFGSLGFITVALVLAKYISIANIAIHYYVFSVVLTVLFSFIVIKNDSKIKIKSYESKQFSLLLYWPFWVSLFLMQISFGGFYNFFTIYETQRGISIETVSYLWTFGVICEIIILFFQAPLLKNNLLLMIKVSIFFTIIRWLMLYFFPESLTISFISQSIHALSFGLYHSAVIMYLYEIYENKKLTQQFMFGLGYGLGGFIGAIIAGWAYGEYLFLYSAIVASLSFGALFIKTKYQS